ncbi:sulfite exporter TauE/SafE family protein [Chloroflexota bacterium]
MPQVIVFVVIFLAVFVQSMAGFGLALVSMALLPGIVGIQVAAPLVALVGIPLEFLLLLKYRSALNIYAVWPLIIASLFGIPLGIFVLKRVDEEIVLTILGIVITCYALYSLLEIKLPQMKHPAWAFGSGFFAGLLGGAYNTAGPPVIVYGNCRGWLPAEFKSNLQSFFLVGTLFVVAAHALSGNLTEVVLVDFLWTVPAIGLGIVAGTWLDRYLNPALFRKVVLVLLVLMGLRLIF